jgi:hypothetical protein
MTDQQVIDAIRRRLNGIEHELLVDPPTTGHQFAVAMLEATREMIRTYSEHEVPDKSLADALKELVKPPPAPPSRSSAASRT